MHSHTTTNIFHSIITHTPSPQYQTAPHSDTTHTSASYSWNNAAGSNPSRPSHPSNLPVDTNIVASPYCTSYCSHILYIPFWPRHNMSLQDSPHKSLSRSKVFAWDRSDTTDWPCRRLDFRGSTCIAFGQSRNIVGRNIECIVHRRRKITSGISMCFLVDCISLTPCTWYIHSTLRQNMCRLYIIYTIYH